MEGSVGGKSRMLHCVRAEERGGYVLMHRRGKSAKEQGNQSLQQNC